MDRNFSEVQQKLSNEREMETKELKDIKATMQRGFSLLGVDVEKNVQKKPNSVRIPNRNPKTGIWQRVVLPKRLAKHRAKAQKSKSAVVTKATVNTVVASAGPNKIGGTSKQTENEQHVKKIKQKPRNKCVFCEKLDCQSSKYCGLSIPWNRRKILLQSLCPDQSYLKKHVERCRKLERGGVVCDFCNEPHHVVYCECLAITKRDAREMEMEQRASTSTAN